MSAASNNSLERMLGSALRSPSSKSRASSSKSDNMPNMNNLNKWLASTRSPGKKSPSSGRLSPGSNFNFNNLAFLPPLSPVQKTGRKIAPRAMPARKQAPTPKRPTRPIAPAQPPQRVASPDVKFAHKFEGTNSGERDSRGRIIYHGKRGGKYVISSIGKRVPHIEKALKNKSNKGALDFTGKMDRKGRKIYRGKRGGEFVISDSGKRINPIV